MTILLVRHAHAGDRGAWIGDDTERPLSEKGRLQSEQIAAYAIDMQPTQLHSSPALRCVQTLTPLGELLGVDVNASARLFEGHGAGPTLDLIDELARAGTSASICSHGDIIPEVIHLLARRGMEASTEGYQKAGVWRLEFVDGNIATGEYIPAPSVEGSTQAG